jgi:MarR family transcriptional regulator, transcriptional regulator for hemolysin
MNRLQSFGFLVKDVSRLYVRNFERHAIEIGLTLAQCKVLAHLSKNEGVSQIRLAEITDTDPMTLVRIIDRMEADGWIERRPDPADRRARQLFLGKGAQPLLQRIWRFGDRAREEAFGEISKAQRDLLMTLLEKVHGNLTELEAAAKKKVAA